MAAIDGVLKMTEHIKICTKKDVFCDECLSLKLISLDMEYLPDSFSLVSGCLQSLYLDFNELTEIPAGVCQEMPNLTILSLIGNNLQYLPSDIDSLGRLEQIYLNENQVKQLPSALYKLNHLKILNAVGNKLKKLEDGIEKLENLHSLYLNENQINCLPEMFGLLASLRILDLECNELSCLPSNFGSLRKLSILNLNNNHLTYLPSGFSEMASLENLDLSANELKELPNDLKSCHCLRKFYADDNSIVDLPDWFGHLPKLEEASVKNNRLHHQGMPKMFGLISKKLRELNFAGNFITSLPESFGELESLEKLDFGSLNQELERRNFQNGNWLATIPDSFGKLIMLKSISIDENQIEELPDSFGCLVNVEYLNLDHNRLLYLPETFGNLRSLCVCSLSKNHIEFLPSSFGQLRKLDDLSLDDNRLTELPTSFNQLKQLKSLDLYNNCLKELPRCLEALTNLIHLDLDSNAFDIPYTDVPQIIHGLKYSHQEHNDKSQRTCSRANLMRDTNCILVESPVQVAEVETSQECYGFNALRNAMRYNMSIWRSLSDFIPGHDCNSQPENSDETHNVHNEGDAAAAVDDAYNYDDDECGDDEYDIDENGYSTICCDQNESTFDNQATSTVPYTDVEDWDKDIEEMDLEANPYGTRPQFVCDEPLEPDLLTYQYLGTDHVFLPSVYHSKPVNRPVVLPVTKQHVEKGQFDDASDNDDDDDNKVSENTSYKFSENCQTIRKSEDVVNNCLQKQETSHGKNTNKS